MMIHRALAFLTAIFVLFAARPAAAQYETAPPPPDDPRIHDIVEAVSAERLEADIRTLADFGTRHTLSDTTSDTRGIGAALAEGPVRAGFGRLRRLPGGRGAALHGGR